MSLLALFDVDGTLFLTHDELNGRAMVGSLGEVYGVALPEDPVDRVDHGGETAKRIARHVLEGAGIDEATIGEKLDEWCGRFSKAYVELLATADTSRWESAPGARQALASLVEGGVRLALLTGNPEPVARARMERLGLAGFFPAGQGSFGCEAEDRVELIRLARERAGAVPGETVEVGDTPRDVSSAEEAGVRSIVVRPPGVPNEHFDGADAVVDDMASVARTLLEWS
jgi:phosphoglycolate phosphatase